MTKVEMNTIMEERIDSFNKYVMSQDIDKMPIGLYSGKMGICIYFFHQARLTQNKIYKKFAEKLLDSIYSQAHIEMSVNVANGLVGICYGINYLIEEKFVSGNANIILEELDDKIFSFLYFNYLENDLYKRMEIIKGVLELSTYFCMRLKNKSLSSNNKYLFKDIVFKSINKIESVDLFEKYSEPPLFSIANYFFPSYLLLLNEVYELNFCNYKLVKIFDLLSDKIKSSYPLLHSNRLFLSGAIKSIEQKKSIYGWGEHIHFLEQNVDFSAVLKNEFRNKNIFALDGITGLYYMTKKLHESVNINYDLLRDKIAISDIWADCMKDETILKTHIGLVTGFCGVILAYQDIQIKIFV
jgi:hypothetical protein